MKTQLIGEFLQLDGWNSARVFSSTKEAREWVSDVNQSGGHHHARRFRRVQVGSSAWNVAIERYIHDQEY